MSGSSNPPSKPPLPANRPRFPTGTVIGGKKVSNQYMSNAVVNAAREGMVSKDQLDATEQKLEAAEQKIQQQQQEIDQANQDIENQKREIDQVQADVLNQQQSAQPSRLQRIGSTIARGARVAGALGPMGMIRSINRSAETNTSLFNFAGADAQNVAVARAGGMGFGSSQGGYALSPRAERAIITTSTDTAAVRVSIGRLERAVSGIAAKMEASESPTSSVKPTKSEEEGGGGGIMGLIGSLFGGLGNLFGGGGAAGLGALLRRGISTIARAIFTKIPIIGPLILVALNIEGAMEEYEKNGLGAAITDLLSGIGSDLTFGLIDKDTIKKFIDEGIKKVSEWWNTAKVGFDGIVNSVYEGVKGFVNTIKATISNILSYIPGGRALARLLGLPEIPEDPTNTEPPNSQDVVRGSYNINSPDQQAEYGRVVQNVLMNPRPGETDEQRVERERLSTLQQEMEGRTGIDGNIQLAPGVAEFISRTANVPTEDQARARNQERAALVASYQDGPGSDGPGGVYPERVEASAATSSSTLSGAFEITSLTRRDPAKREAISLIEQAASRMNIQRPVGGVLENGRVVAIKPAGRRDLIPVTPEAVTSQSGDMAPAPDLRSQSIATGANEPSVVVVQQPAPMSQQTAPPAIPAQGSSRGAATGRAPAPATHPDRPNDVGSAAMSGSR